MDSVGDTGREVDGSTHLLADEVLNHLPDKMVQQNGDEDCVTEKLMPDDGKIRSNKDASEVQFVSAGSQNGDAKIDIENLKVVFAGMGKEELMKFANDPFWVRLRWFLFILIWLLWFGMLAGAIAIIVIAPKCPAPAPLEWWEEAPLYQVYVRSIKDGSGQDGIGDLKGLKSDESLNYIENLGVKGIIISPILKSTNDVEDTVEDFKDVNPVFGTLQDFKELASAMKKRGLHLVMNIVPNHSSKKHSWFMKSEAKEEPYTNYYVWNPGHRNGTGHIVPPNNWKSIFGGSAWEWSTQREEFYLHQFRIEQPDLNFHNPNVTDEFKAVLSFWLEHGASGFEFDKIQYLLEEEHLRDESQSDVKGSTHDQYEFYSHKHTAYLPGVLDVLSDWKEVFNQTTGIFSVTHSFRDPFLLSYGDVSVVDVVRYTDVFSLLSATFSADDLYSAVEKWRDNKTMSSSIRRYWELGNLNTSRVATRFSSEIVDGLNMVVMLMEGTPITYYGEELGMEDNTDSVHFARSPLSWRNSTSAGFSDVPAWIEPSPNFEVANIQSESEAKESSLQVYKSLVKARSNPSIMYGTFESAVYNGTVYAYTRLKKGNPGYLVALNPSENDETVSFMNFRNMADKLTVIIQSSNFKQKISKTLSSEAVTLPAKGAFVATFVPSTE